MTTHTRVRNTGKNSETFDAADASFTPKAELGRDSVQVTATAFLVLFCVVGVAIWGLPFFYDFMVQQFGWTRAQVTSGNAISKLVVGPVFGYIAGCLVDRYGPRKLMLAGILMTGTALAGLGAISTLGLFYFFYMLNALGYVCGGPLPNQVLLSKHFLKARGKAMGIAYLGIGMGGAAAPWIAHAFIQQCGWQVALRLVGLLIIAVAGPAAFFLKETPPSPVNKGARASLSVELKNAFMSVPFFLLTAGSMLSIAAVSGTQQNLKLFLSLDLHFTQSESARILSLVLGFSVAGRLIMGWLADCISKKYVMLLIYLLVAAAIPLLFAAAAPVAIFLFTGIFGVALGGDYLIVPLMTAEVFGLQLLGRLLGVILTAGSVAEAVSPWFVGHLRDTTGSYSRGFFVLTGMALLGALSVAGLPKGEKSQ